MVAIGSLTCGHTEMLVLCTAHLGIMAGRVRKGDQLSPGCEHLTCRVDAWAAADGSGKVLSDDRSGPKAPVP